VTVNSVTNKVYVANRQTERVIVIDGATNDTTSVPLGGTEGADYALAVNPVTNKVYVTNYQDGDMTVIDGATNDTTLVCTGEEPRAIAVNPVTNKIYVADRGCLTVITDAPANDTRVRAEFDRLQGDTTWLARPNLTGKGVNRSTPGRTAMLGVGNRMNTSQAAWDWATITSGAGTDSVTWSYNWGADSLILGENFVCCVPLEDQAATTNDLGLGTPFVGNLEVYPVYRIGLAGGVEESPKPQATSRKLGPTIIRGVLFLPGVRGPGTGDRAELLDVSGRKAMNLRAGANDVRAMPPGVYFVREAQAQAQAQAVRKVVVTR
jgi:YVTN family beta-propeller protein